MVAISLMVSLSGGLGLGLDSKGQQGADQGEAGKGYGGGEHGLRGAGRRGWAVGLLVLVHGAGFLWKAPRRGRGVRFRRVSVLRLLLRRYGHCLARCGRRI